MQVSWIDPDEVRALFAQIAGPERTGNPSAWEVHTLPVAPPASSEAVHLLGDTSNNESQTPEPELRDHPVGPGNAEVWRIREKLRALREKAQESGILARPAVPSPSPELAAPSPCAPAPAPVEAAPPAAAPAQDYEPLFASPAPVPASAPAEPAAEPPPAVPEMPSFTVPTAGLGERLNALARWVCERLDTPDVLIVDDYGDVLWGGSAQTPLVLSAIMAWQSAQHSTASATTSNTPSRIDKELSGGRTLTILASRTRYGVVNLAALRQGPMSQAEADAVQDALFRTVEG